MQLVAVYYALRGLSLTGPLTGPGILIGIISFTAGVWLALDQPWWMLLLLAVPALLVAVLVLMVAGVIVNIRHDPAREFLQPNPDHSWIAHDAQIPARMVHVAQGAKQADYLIPGTFIKPKGWESESSDGSGKVVLLICGAGDCRTSFKWRLFQELLTHDIAVLTIDPPGHGDFLHVPMTMANARVAGKAALDWLCAQPGVRSVGACGISFGGNQVASLAAADQRIRAVALISTPVRLQTLTRRIYTAEAASLFIWPRNLGLLRYGSLLTLWREWQTLKGAWYGESLYDMIERFDTPSAVRAIGTRPKLFVHGTRDVAIPLLNAHTLYEAAAPNRLLLPVRQATHISPVLFPGEMRQLAQWFSTSLNYNHADAQQAE